MKAIIKPRRERVGRGLVHPDFYLLPPCVNHGAHIVYAVGLVGVVMRLKNRIQPSGVGVYELGAHVRRGVDENAGLAALSCLLHQKRASSSVVFRMIGIAVSPRPIEARHAAR